MRIVLALVTCVALAEAGALVWLAGRRAPDPLEAPAPGLPTVVTHTVYATTSGSPGTGPSQPVEGPDTDDPAELKRRLAAAQVEVREANRAVESMAPRMRSQAAELERLRTELAHLRKNGVGAPTLPPDPAPGMADDQLTVEQQRERLRRMGMESTALAWTVGYGIPEGAIPDASEAQRVATESVLRDEEPRMVAALRDFVRQELGAAAPPGLDGMGGAALVEQHVSPMLAEGFTKLADVPLLTHLRLQRGEQGLEDVLGADHRTARLARIAANVRRETWGQLERHLAPDQVRGLKERHLRIGLYKYVGWQLAIGPTNAY